MGGLGNFVLMMSDVKKFEKSDVKKVPYGLSQIST